MNQPEVVVLSAVRTPIGKYGGALKDIPPTVLGAKVVSEAVKRAQIDAKAVNQVVFGNVIHTEPKDMYLSRVVGINAGLPVETPALTVNRLCGSGLQAIICAAQTILLGDAKVAIGGGAESMSRSGYWIPGLRWGQRMNDATVIDAMVGALTDPFDQVHMGITAENIAKKWGISREDQDKLAVESHHRAANAVRSCMFKEQILPIEIKSKQGTQVVEKDEQPRGDVTLEGLSALKPAFDKNGTVTPGNASGINDGAAAVVLMDATAARDNGFKPLARILGYTVVGVEPKYMGMGPVPAVEQLLSKLGLKKEDINVWELNEAFAAQALAVIRDLGLEPEQVNPNGSGIALGHPVGASGAILTVKALYELKRIGGRYAVVSMCIGGGQGIAAAFEAVNN
jgi:acetyl-CoA C-acetyltransferase